MDDEDDTAETSGTSAPEPETTYEFEGFDVQVNERIALTPATARANGLAHG